jgi:2-methylcitrate dehydratase PrpD
MIHASQAEGARMAKVDRRTMLKLLAATTGTMAVGGQVTLSRAATLYANAVPPPAMDFTFSERIADYIVRARFTDLPAAAIHTAKAQVAFFLSCALDASSSECAGQIRDSPSPPSEAAESASVIGDRLRLAVADAAFANALLFGDSLSDGALACQDAHAGVFTLPTALALGEAKRMSGRDLILALVVSHEVLGKLTRADLQWTGPLPCRSTNIFGGLGPVTVAGCLLGLDHERMTHAVSAGAHLSLSIAESPMLRHYYGQIARHGTRAAQIVEAGALCYSRTVLDGEHGLYCSLLEGGPSQLTKVIDKLGYEEIVTAAQQGNLASERAWQNRLAASGRRLLSRGQLQQMMNLLSRLDQVDDVSTLVATAVPRLARTGY